MKVVAVIVCRNENGHIANCLRHLVRNDIHFAVIDNESTDDTLEIVERPEFRDNLVTLSSLPYDGTLNLSAVLNAKMDMMQRLDADWLVHLDADEIMHSSRQHEILNAAIARMDSKGFNVINFDEFVFLPVDAEYQPDCEGHQKLLHYYFFEPKPVRLMRAFKPGLGFSWVRSGGHTLQGTNLKLADENFVLRHYIFRSQQHAFDKYSMRKFPESEVKQLGWHGNRVNQPMERFKFPPREQLEKLTSSETTYFCKERLFQKHYWQWE